MGLREGFLFFLWTCFYCIPVTHEHKYSCVAVRLLPPSPHLGWLAGKWWRSREAHLSRASRMYNGESHKSSFFISRLPFCHCLVAASHPDPTDRQATGHVDSLRPGSKLVALASCPSIRSSACLPCFRFRHPLHLSLDNNRCFPLSETRFCAR